jgi:hypothetical protein
MVENGPIPAVHEVVRWRIVDLCQWLWEEYEISVSKQTLSRELRAMGYRKLSARPRCQSALNVDPASASNRNPVWCWLVPVVHRGDPRVAECPSRG